jgi:hypothetical protein
MTKGREVTAKLGNFLIYLQGEDRVAEWNGNLPNCWGITSKEGMRWDTCPQPITDTDRLAILKKFGIKDLQELLPFRQFIVTSPKALIQLRRKKEKKSHLRKLNVYRDGDTNESLAELFD